MSDDSNSPPNSSSGDGSSNSDGSSPPDGSSPSDGSSSDSSSDNSSGGSSSDNSNSGSSSDNSSTDSPAPNSSSPTPPSDSSSDSGSDSGSNSNAPPPASSNDNDNSDNSSPPSPPKSPDNNSDSSSSSSPESSPSPPPPESNSDSTPSSSNKSPPSSDDSSSDNSTPSNDNNSSPPPPKTENPSQSSSNSQSKNSPSRDSPKSPDSSSNSPAPEKSLPFITNTPSDNSSPSRPSHSDTTSSDSNSRIDSTPSRNSDRSSSTQTSNHGSSDSNHKIQGIAIGMAVAGVVVVLVAFIILFSRKKRKRSDGLATYYIPPNNHSGISEGYYYTQEKPLGGSPPDSAYYGSKPPMPLVSANMNGSQRGQGFHSGLMDSGSKSSFSYEELIDITDGFSKDNLLGEGGFGCVYKGRLQDGREVAVKELKAGSGQGEREFQAEVEIISRVHHRHLVSLVGYCIAQHHRLLVYEFVPNDTLENHLNGKASVLDWPSRQKIAIGSARGLAYLHEDCHPRIIHRDIKSANILLDSEFEAQVADFGLAKLSNDTRTHVSTRVMGTFGYMAPEYASSGKLTDRSDVYSFGVVLLELITGRKPVDASQPLGDESLVEWARPVLNHAMETGDYTELIDPRLENIYVKSEMFRMVEAAAACVRHSAPKRPRMVQVVRALDFDDETDLSNGVKFGQSQVFEANQYAADMQKFRNMAFGSSQFSGEYGYSGEQRRSGANSGEFRGGQPPPRPPGHWNNSQELDPRTANRGELMPPRPPGSAFAPQYMARPGEYSSGEYDSGPESETRAIIRGGSNRSDGSYMYNARGIP